MVPSEELHDLVKSEPGFGSVNSHVRMGASLEQTWTQPCLSMSKAWGHGTGQLTCDSSLSFPTTDSIFILMLGSQTLHIGAVRSIAEDKSEVLLASLPQTTWLPGYWDTGFFPHSKLRGSAEVKPRHSVVIPIMVQVTSSVTFFSQQAGFKQL